MNFKKHFCAISKIKTVVEWEHPVLPLTFQRLSSTFCILCSAYKIHE